MGIKKSNLQVWLLGKDKNLKPTKKPLPLIIAVLEFISRKQLPGESPETFMHALQFLVGGCKESFGKEANLDSFLVLLFITGILDTEAKEYLLEKAPSKIDQMLKTYNLFCINRTSSEKMNRPDAEMHNICTCETACYTCGQFSCLKGSRGCAKTRKCRKCNVCGHEAIICEQWHT